MATKDPKDGARHIICQNKRARHDYAIERKLEAGIALRGTEVKSCREGKAQIQCQAATLQVTGELAK